MSEMIRRLHTRVMSHLSEDPTRMPLGGLGIFHCRTSQSIHDVPIHQPLLVLVTSGMKEIVLGGRRMQIRPGELLMLPADCRVEVFNHPGEDGEHYLGLAMVFHEESISQCRRIISGETAPVMTPLWHARADALVVAAMEQWFDWCCRHPTVPELVRHRQVELLLLLARTGCAGNLIHKREVSWRERVAQVISLDPARDWSAGLLSRQLGIGESTLRRRLAEEGTGFRELLEETRLMAGLSLLQETFWSVVQVADAVGYRSQSRFSERFKRRFGLTPSELKRTRMSGSGEKQSV